MTTTTLPLAAGTWKTDPAHSAVHFTVRHLGLAKVRGRFNDFDVTVAVAERLEDVRVEATIDLASIDTNQPDRDAHLRSTDFFAAHEHPQMTFRSTAVRHLDGDEYELDGELTINEVTKSVTLAVEFTGTVVNPADDVLRAGFEATTEINRKDFGVDLNVPLEVGGVMIGEKVKVELDVELVPPA